MIEPFRSATNRSAANVTTGSAAFLKACRQITRRSGSPLMRASLTYSLPRTSSIDRSEEHTSELQSLRHLVCRLLLEKKKTKQTTKTVAIQTEKNYSTT